MTSPTRFVTYRPALDARGNIVVLGAKRDTVPLTEADRPSSETPMRPRAKRAYSDPTADRALRAVSRRDGRRKPRVRRLEPIPQGVARPVFTSRNTHGLAELNVRLVGHAPVGLTR